MENSSRFGLANKMEDQVIQFEEVSCKIFKYDDVGWISEIFCEIWLGRSL